MGSGKYAMRKGYIQSCFFSAGEEVAAQPEEDWGLDKSKRVSFFMQIKMSYI